MPRHEHCESQRRNAHEELRFWWLLQDKGKEDGHNNGSWLGLLKDWRKPPLGFVNAHFEAAFIDTHDWHLGRRSIVQPTALRPVGQIAEKLLTNQDFTSECFHFHHVRMNDHISCIFQHPSAIPRHFLMLNASRIMIRALAQSQIKQIAEEQPFCCWRLGDYLVD